MDPMDGPATASALTDPLLADGAGATIAQAERHSGLPRATIRIWERRYGFPAPLRDERGERRYPQDQLEQLLLMRRLVERGHRPARLLELPLEAMRALLPPDAGRGGRRDGHPLLAALRRHEASAVRALLQDRLQALGLAEFAGGELPAMARAVGDAWAAGALEIHEEHLFTDSVSELLRGAIGRLGGRLRPEAPRVILTTLAHESHGLGLLMAQAVLALQGCPTVMLGLHMPTAQIAAAAQAYRADLVGLSVSANANGLGVRSALQELRGLLPPAVRVWVGGNHPVLAHRPLDGVRAVTDAHHIPDLLAEDFALPPLA